MELHLEEDSVPFVVRGPDNVKDVTVPFIARGPDKNDTIPFIVRGPDKSNTIPVVARGPDISDTGGFMGIPENSPRSDEHLKESISLCSSGVSSMNSSLTSSGDLSPEDTLSRILVHRDYEEHSDDGDSRLYGSGTEPKLSSSVEVHYPPSTLIAKNPTTVKPLNVLVKKADEANPELRKSFSLYQSIYTDAVEAQFSDNSDILSGFSQLSIKDDSYPHVYGGRLVTGATEQDITGYRSCEAAIDKSDLMKPDEDHERCQGMLDKLKSFIDQNKISERGKNNRNKSYHEVPRQDNAHGPNSQRRGPYNRFPSAPASTEVYPEPFRGNQYGNVPEAMQQHELHENDYVEELVFVDKSVMEDFIIKYSPERDPMTDTNEQVIQGPPLALPSFVKTFHTRANMYSTAEKQTTPYQTNHQTNNDSTQYMNKLNLVSQTHHNALWNSQYQFTNPAVNPSPQFPPVNISSQGYNAAETNHYNIPNYDQPFDSSTNMQNVMINDYNNTYSNQSFAGPAGILSSPTRPPINVPNHGHFNMIHYDNQGKGTRRTNISHNSPTTSIVPSSPTSSEKSVPSPTSQTSLKSPAMMEAQSPCPSTPEGNIPNIISNCKNLSVYSSNSSLSSGHSSSSAKATAGESPRNFNDQDGPVNIQGSIGTCFVSSPDYPHSTYFGPIPEVDDIANTTGETAQNPNRENYSESDKDENDDDDDDRNTPVHDLAYLAGDEFKAECKMFMEHDNGSELRRSMNVTNGDERTPLYIAVIRNNIVAVKCFLDQGADPTKYCYRRVSYGHGNYMQYYENVLHLACEKGFEELVDLLVDHPSKQDLVNARRQGDDKTPLLICLNAHDVNQNRLRIVRQLLSKGANLNLKETHSGKSPLMLAIEKHEIDFVREELGRLNPDYRRELLEQTDYDGNTCLHYSAQIASRDSNGRPRDNHTKPTHTNLKPLTDEQVQRFNSSLNLDGANIDAQNLDKVRPKDLRRELIAIPRGLHRKR